MHLSSSQCPSIVYGKQTTSNAHPREEIVYLYWRINVDDWLLNKYLCKNKTITLAHMASPLEG